jgi:hypothetical protein
VQLPSEDECAGRRDGPLCDGSNVLTCLEQRVSDRRDCAAQGLICAESVGCKVCEPRSTVCEGARRSRCADDGNALVFVEECATGTACGPLGCKDLCADAEADRSYLGCDYWPVFTSNGQLSSRFRPAVAIGNGNLVSAHVWITRGERWVAELDVAARSATTVELDFAPELKNGTGSVLLRQGAYHLRASVPITVHQFNPLSFELPGDCVGEEPSWAETDGVCNSYTNDASLLLPAAALRPDPETTGVHTTDFIAVSRASFVASDGAGKLSSLPGFVAITAVGAQPVKVRVRSSAHTTASAALDGERIEALAPGSPLERTLSPGDVLQLRSAAPSSCPGTLSGTFCDPGGSYDLTGTEVSADGPVQVISGHDCSNVPFDRAACDHLEESMVPLRAWGQSAVLSLPQKLIDSRYVLRVVSGADQNLITFDPAIHEPATLGRGEVLELSASQPVHVLGTGRLMVAQYLIGQGARGATLSDPSLGVAVPVDQYRARYNFVTPATYRLNYVDIIARHDEVVTLDGALVIGFSPVGESPYGVATVQLREAGAHEIRGSSAYGLAIVLYGVGSYTSYMLPGGLDLGSLGMGI